MSRQGMRFPWFLGFINFLGLIYFLEKVPKPLISTLLSKATASTIDSKIESIANKRFR